MLTPGLLKPLIAYIEQDKLNMPAYYGHIPLQIVVVPDSAAAQKVPPVPGLRRFSSSRTKLLAARCECLHLIKINCFALTL
jgi:hypothetical protein